MAAKCKSLPVAFFLLAAVLHLPYLTCAQLIHVAIAPGLAKYIGETNEFSAKALWTSQATTGQAEPADSIELKFYFSRGSFRTETDMTDYKTKKYSVSEEEKANWRNLRMAESVTIYNRSHGEVWQYFPKQKGGFGRELTKEEASVFRTWPAATEIKIGTDILDGHQCTKYQVGFPKESDRLRANFWELHEWNVDGLVWRADDLNGFPVRVECKGQSFRWSVQFSDIKPAKQDAKLFQLPTGYTRPNSFQFPGWPGQQEIFQ